MGLADDEDELVCRLRRFNGLLCWADSFYLFIIRRISYHGNQRQRNNQGFHFHSILFFRYKFNAAKMEFPYLKGRSITATTPLVFIPYSCTEFLLSPTVSYLIVERKGDQIPVFGYAINAAS